MPFREKTGGGIVLVSATDESLSQPSWILVGSSAHYNVVVLYLLRPTYLEYYVEGNAHILY